MLRMPGTARSALLSYFLSLVAAIALAQSPTPESNAAQAEGQLPPKFVQMLKTQAAWDEGFNNPSGPRLQFAKFGDFERPDGHFAHYRIFAPGAEEGKPYIFALLKIGVQPENVQIMTSPAYVNRKGLLLTRKPKPDEEDSESVAEGVEYDIGIQAANGEPLRFLVRSKDNKVFLPGTLVPYPIESANNGCKLEARLAVPEGQAILIYADGFPPNSPIEVQGNSAGESKEAKHMTDANGHVQFFDLPSVVGKDSGTVTESISSKECNVSVSIPWGKGTYQKH